MKSLKIEMHFPEYFNGIQALKNVHQGRLEHT